MRRWAELQEELAVLLDLDGAARAQRLTKLEGEDSERAAELRRLLQAAEATHWDAQMSGGAAAPVMAAITRDPVLSEDLSGSRIGAWQLLKLLGRGGMGAVYLAARADGAYEQQAALKVLAGRAPDNRLSERFLSERQILATLEHPGIARLLDGGVTEANAPYLVMEFVDGDDLRTYVSRAKCALKARLTLFTDLLDAVLAAHRKLVVHGDLKPDNILVSRTGTLKLVDFGVARTLDDVEERAVLALTPGYSSPERLEGAPLGPPADIYALGVILYLLLTDRLPHQVASMGPDERAQHIRSQKPSAPSTSAALPGINAELDAICLRALAADPAQRYGSVEQLRAELAQLAAHRPVLAMGAARGYRLKKFARRHRLGLTAAGTVLLAIGTGSFAALQQAERARLEASRAELVSGFMASLFDGANPFGTWKEEPTLRDVLARAEQRAATELREDPAARAKVQSLIGQALLGAGDYDRAVAVHEAALAAAQTATGPDSTEAAQARSALAHALIEKGDYGAARDQAQRALLLIERAGGVDDILRSDALSNLAVAHSSLGERERARELHEAALTLRQQALPADHVGIADSKMSLASVNAALGNLEPVLELNRAAREIYRKQYGPAHPMTIRAQNGVASGAFLTGDHRTALTAFTELLREAEQRLGLEHPELALLHNNQARTLTELGRFKEARDAYAAAAARVSAAPEQRLLSISVRLNQAALAVEFGEFEVGLPSLQRAAADLSELVGPAHALGYRVDVQVGIARALAATADSAATLAELIADPRATAQPQWQARARAALAWILLLEGRSVAAATEFQAAEPILSQAWPIDSWRRAEADLLAALIRRNVDGVSDGIEQLAALLPDASVRRQRALKQRDRLEEPPRHDNHREPS